MGVVDIWGNYHFHGKPKIPDGKSNGMPCNKEDPPQRLIHGRLTLTTQHNTLCAHSHFKPTRMQVPDVSNGKSLYTTRPIPLGKLQEIWAVISGDEIALFFALLSIYLDILCSGTFSLRLKFYRFIFMHKISIPGGF